MINGPLSIIHTVPSIEEVGGPTYSVRRLCETLAERGENVTLAAIGPKRLADCSKNIKTFPLGIGPVRLGRSPRMKRWLYGKAESQEVGLFHNHSLWMMPNVYPGQIAHKHNVPLVVSPRGCFTKYAMQSGSRMKSLFWVLVQKPALNAVSCFHATAASEYDDIRRMGFPQPVAIIPNGIDIPDLGVKQYSSRRTLLFLGRIHPNKGLDILMPAWQRVQQEFSDWDLIIVGPDNDGYLEEIKRLSGALSLSRVRFLEGLYGKEKWRAYANADLFVLPSYSENFGLTVAESLASGTPAIVFKGAPWEGLISKKAGWWVDIGLEPLVETLKVAMAKPRESLEEMGKQGLTWMREEFLWPHVGREMAETYKWILGRGEKPGCVLVE